MQTTKNLNVPRHLGIICDGNRRWAKKHGLEVWKGHEEGVKKFEKILDWCQELGIKIVTFYAFSMENFSRSKQEVAFLMNLIKRELKRMAKDKRVHENKVKVRIIGRIYLLPKDLQEAIREVEEATKNYSNYQLNLAIAYGGRAEILDATKKLARLVKEGKIDIEDINEELFSEELYEEMPDVDLVIRTSESRLSGFLIWQSTYSEIIFLPDKFFPELTKQDFLSCIEEFSKRERRFGK